MQSEVARMLGKRLMHTASSSPPAMITGVSYPDTAHRPDSRQHRLAQVEMQPSPGRGGAEQPSAAAEMGEPHPCSQLGQKL